MMFFNPSLSRLFILLMLVVSFNSQASMLKNLTDSKLVAQVDNWAVPKSSFEIYYAYHASLKHEVTQESLLTSIIDDRLISQHALQTIGAKKISDETAVGYKSEVAQRDLFINILRSQFDAQISKSIVASDKGTLQSYVTKAFDMSQDQFKNYVSSQTKKQTFLLVYKLSERQIEIAKQTVLMSYKFPDAKAEDITLWDIYQITNVQERIALHKSDFDKVKTLLQRLMATNYTLYWVKHFSGLSNSEITTINEFIYQNQIAGQYYRYSGFKAGIHQDNPKLKEVAEQVSLAEIKRYYQQHKNDFSTIIKLKARHITLGSQSEADQVYKVLKSGLSFKDAIQKYSIAKDKHSTIPGNLGWIERSDKNKGWLKSIPFTQKEKYFSPPFMSPLNMGKERVWEIVYVDERVDGFYPADSETVRYKSSRHIAELKISEQVKILRKKLQTNASIRLNKAFVGIVNREQGEIIDVFHQEHTHDESEHH